MDYPQRPPFFAHRFIRLMTKSAAAMDIGPEGAWMLSLIVMQEDSCRYTKHVAFWNSQLLALMGMSLTDENRLRRIRAKCIAHGWLHYIPGAKAKSARYHVTIPDAVNKLEDGPCDESDEQYRHNTDKYPTQCDENPTRIRRESDNIHTSPYPSPSPEERSPTKTNEQPPGPEQALSTWVRWQRKEPDDTAEGLAELRQLIATHGPKLVQQHAERLAHAAAGKVWPNQISDALLTASRPKEVPPKLNLGPKVLQ